MMKCFTSDQGVACKRGMARAQSAVGVFSCGQVVSWKSVGAPFLLVFPGRAPSVNDERRPYLDTRCTLTGAVDSNIITADK